MIKRVEKPLNQLNNAICESTKLILMGEYKTYSFPNLKSKTNAIMALLDGLDLAHGVCIHLIYAAHSSSVEHWRSCITKARDMMYQLELHFT